MNFKNLFDKITPLLPSKKGSLEALGYILLGSSMILAISLYSYSPLDYSFKGKVVNQIVDNVAGPFGAWLSRVLMIRIGMIALLWPIVIGFWGIGVTFGFLQFPNPKRAFALLWISMLSSAYLHITLPTTSIARPDFGYGGRIGEILGNFAFQNFYYWGGIVFLSMMMLMGLSLTGNIALSQTSGRIRQWFYSSKKYLILSFKLFSALYEKLKTPSDIVKEKNMENEIEEYYALASGASFQVQHPIPANPPSLVPIKKEKVIKEKEMKKDEISSDALLNIYYDGPSNDKPSARLFMKSPPNPKVDPKAFEKLARELTQQLKEFQVEGEIKGINQGPIVTTIEFEPAPGTKVSKISNLQEDLARLLRAESLRILAPIPGKKVVGFEVPNSERRMIGFANLLDHKDFKSSKITLPIAMGVDIFGEPIIQDLAEMPHLLVAGSTGSGKSVFMNTLVASLIARHSAKDLRFIMIDPKMVEMAAYNDLPHMATPVVTDAAVDAKATLEALVVEMEDRYKKMQALGAKNIKSFNETIKKSNRSEFPKYDGQWQTMPYIVLIIDEMADMMMVLGKEAEAPITRIAQKARAAGIHMVIATQRPSSDVVTGLIKANFPTRVAFRVLSGIDSRTILDQSGAETLLGKGDMLYLAAGGLKRIHGAFLSEDEVKKMVKVAKSTK